ncbi:MAG: hypothetical protein ACW98U_00035 [Candidatus Thorarchaeota archaeon]
MTKFINLIAKVFDLFVSFSLLSFGKLVGLVIDGQMMLNTIKCLSKFILAV